MNRFVLMILTDQIRALQFEHKVVYGMNLILECSKGGKLMPNGDYMEPTEEEKESQLICQFIEYLYKYMQKPVPIWISGTLHDYYGDVEIRVEAKRKLLECLKGLSHKEMEVLVYDAHNKMSRKLADWWEEYQKEVAEAETEKKEKQAKALLKASTLKNFPMMK